MWTRRRPIKLSYQLNFSFKSTSTRSRQKYNHYHSTWKNKKFHLVYHEQSLLFLRELPFKRDSVTRFSTSGFFHESVSPKHLSILLRPFRIFSKIRGDIRGSRCTTGVNDTGGKWKKSSSRKVLIILFGHLWVVELTYILIFAFKFTWRCLQPDIVFIICHRCQWHRWCTLTCEYLREFSKKFEMVLMGYSGAGGKLIHKKTRSKKSRDTVPLKGLGHEIEF